jgi:hypothetical protein
MIAAASRPRDDVMHLQALPSVTASPSPEALVEYLSTVLPEALTAILAGVTVPAHNRALEPHPDELTNQVRRIWPIGE